MIQQSPKSGDRVTLKFHPGEYTIAACFGQHCGIMSELWPLGQSTQIALNELATIGGQPVSFPHQQSPRKT